MRTVDVEERRARLALRHRLAPVARVATPVEAAAAFVGLHATDPASVYLSALARVDGFDVPAMERALYDERSLLKILGMRRTMFVVPRDLAAVVHASCTVAIAARERRRDIAMLESAGIADAARWLADAEAATVAALTRRGEAVATELTKDVPALALQIPVGQGKKWQGTIGMSTRVLFLLSMEGRIVRARPRGSWISSQYRWTALDRWVPGGLEPWDVEGARAELVRRWLAAYGPADGDGLGRPRLVPGPASRCVVRHERERGPNDLVVGPGRRRLGTARGRPDRVAAAGGRWLRRRGGRGARGREARGVDRRGPDHTAVPDAAREGALDRLNCARRGR